MNILYTLPIEAIQINNMILKSYSPQYDLYINNLIDYISGSNKSIYILSRSDQEAISCKYHTIGVLEEIFSDNIKSVLYIRANIFDYTIYDYLIKNKDKYSAMIHIEEIYTSTNNEKLESIMIDDSIIEIYIMDKNCNSYINIIRDAISSKKEENNISWDEYFMGIAQLSSLRSKDPKTKVGSVIVGEDNRILSIGYNGFPNNCSDEEFPWVAEAENELDKKDFYVVHSELNAILNYKGNRTNLEKSKIYVTLFPCCECAKAIIQCGIKEIIFKQDKESIKTQAAKRMFDSSGVKYRKYEETNRKETIYF